MKITFESNPNAEIDAFLIGPDKTLPEPATALDEACSGLLTQALETHRFSGKSGQTVSVVMPKDSPVQCVVLVGAGHHDERTERECELIGASLYKSHSKNGYESLNLHCAPADQAVRMALGAKLAAYRFDTYRTNLKDEDKPSLEKLNIATEDPAETKSKFLHFAAATDGTYLARDLVNLAPNDLYPESYAKRIQELEEHGLETTVLGEAELEELGMNAMLAVGRGSTKESKLVLVRWQGGNSDERPVALVGKGVTFDAGGISLKPGGGMESMRGDMGGSAAVIGAMLALAKRKAKVNVTGLVGLVENMPDADAFRPGDILTSASGATIEVQNTDAEGRLVLCDVLWYTQKHVKPRAIVDLATLTGAVVTALGHHHAGLYSNDDELANQLTKAGEVEGENVWRLPLGKAYDKQLKSQFADMRNIGGRAAGSITAAQFLKRFIEDDVKWAHLDIAGVAWVEGDKSALDPSWASGFGPRLLDRWIADNYED